jgi:hypothetical protein
MKSVAAKNLAPTTRLSGLRSHSSSSPRPRFKAAIPYSCALASVGRCVRSIDAGSVHHNWRASDMIPDRTTGSVLVHVPKLGLACAGLMTSNVIRAIPPPPRKEHPKPSQNQRRRRGERGTATVLRCARTMVALGVEKSEKSADCSSASRRSSNEPIRVVSPPLLLPDHIAYSHTLELSTGRWSTFILLQLCPSQPASAAQPYDGCSRPNEVSLRLTSLQGSTQGAQST